jgi:Tfp pilus assembly protein FimT
MKKQQLGVTLTGLMVSSVIIAILALLGLKVVPEYMEYGKILSAVKKIANSSNASTSVSDVRKAYDRQADVDYISSIKGEELDVSKEGGAIVISFTYEKRIPLVANVSLLIDFEGSSKGSSKD